MEFNSYFKKGLLLSSALLLLIGQPNYSVATDESPAVLTEVKPAVGAFRGEKQNEEIYVDFEEGFYKGWISPLALVKEAYESRTLGTEATDKIWLQLLSKLREESRRDNDLRVGIVDTLYGIDQQSSGLIREANYIEEAKSWNNLRKFNTATLLGVFEDSCKRFRGHEFGDVLKHYIPKNEQNLDLITERALRENIKLARNNPEYSVNFIRDTFEEAPEILERLIRVEYHEQQFKPRENVPEVLDSEWKDAASSLNCCRYAIKKDIFFKEYKIKNQFSTSPFEDENRDLDVAEENYKKLYELVPKDEIKNLPIVLWRVRDSKNVPYKLTSNYNKFYTIFQSLESVVEMFPASAIRDKNNHFSFFLSRENIIKCMTHKSELTRAGTSLATFHKYFNTCHGDAHENNIYVDWEGRLFFIDNSSMGQFIQTYKKSPRPFLVDYWRIILPDAGAIRGLSIRDQAKHNKVNYRQLRAIVKFSKGYFNVLPESKAEAITQLELLQTKDRGTELFVNRLFDDNEESKGLAIRAKIKELVDVSQIPWAERNKIRAYVNCVNDTFATDMLFILKNLDNCVIPDGDAKIEFIKPASQPLAA